ncbi:hypothetical protein [Marinicella sp. W31]|uniref:hypothetical protein n=1 Tax=Marinicella sp. W31 TaxID=3023713 RepID=UPI003756D942
MLNYIIILFLVHSYSFANASQMNSAGQDRLDIAKQKVLDQLYESQGTIITLGIDPACDANNLQDAVDDAFNLGFGEIRLATNTTFANANINAVSLNIIGGYANCTDARNGVLSNDKTIVNSVVGGQAVININNALVNIENLIVQNGARGIKVTGTQPVNIKNTIIRNNAGFTIGGGLSAEMAESVFLQDVRIHNNTAISRGAGIFSIESEIFIVGESSIDNNILTDDDSGTVGAGIYGIDSEITVVGGSNTGAVSGISLNRSAGGGGGIFMTRQGASPFVPKLLLTGGELSIDGIVYGDLSQPLILFDNRAGFNGSTGSGGGIYIREGTQAELINVSITENRARVNGAGILASDPNTELTIRRSLTSCWSEDGCNYLGQNRAADTAGGLLVINGANAHVSATQITENWANEATAAFVGGTGSELFIASSFIYNNGREGQQGLNDNSVLKSNNGGSLRINQATVVDNLSTNAVINVVDAALVLNNSFIYNPVVGPFLNVTGSSTQSVNCILVDDINNNSSSSITAINNTDYSVAFVGPPGNYHLTDNSIAIDQCASASQNALQDIDNEDFGFDDARYMNINGSYDAGADENRNYDLIFIDGFDENIASGN